MKEQIAGRIGAREISHENTTELDYGRLLLEFYDQVNGSGVHITLERDQLEQWVQDNQRHSYYGLEPDRLLFHPIDEYMEDNLTDEAIEYIKENQQFNYTITA